MLTWSILCTFLASCTSFYPTRDARYDYLAIRAFNVEVSSIADNVTNPQIARLRYQWWRDAIASLSSVSRLQSSLMTGKYTERHGKQDTPVPHPTVIALHRAFRRRKLSSYRFTRLIDAKERNMLDSSYSSLSDLTAYAQATDLSLLMLQMQILSPSQISKGEISGIPLSTIDHSLSHLATYIGLARTLQGLHYFAGKKRVITIPRDIGSEYGIVDEHIFRSLPLLDRALAGDAQDSTLVPGTSIDPATAVKPLIDACEELVSLARLERLKSRWTLGLPSAKGEPEPDQEHAELAQGRQLSRVPESLTPLYLSAIPAKSFLDAFVSSAHCNPLHPAIRQAPKRNWKLPWQIMWNNWRGQF